MIVKTFNQFKEEDAALESNLNESVKEKVEKTIDNLKKIATFGADDKDLKDFKSEDMEDGFQDLASFLDGVNKKLIALLKKNKSK